jgi:hypothetical protein
VSARNVLFWMVTAFFLTSMLLIYNAFYQPVPASGIGLPAIVQRI